MKNTMKNQCAVADIRRLSYHKYSGVLTAHRVDDNVPSEVIDLLSNKSVAVYKDPDSYISSFYYICSVKGAETKVRRMLIDYEKERLKSLLDIAKSHVFEVEDMLVLLEKVENEK